MDLWTDLWWLIDGHYWLIWLMMDDAVLNVMMIDKDNGKFVGDWRWTINGWLMNDE